jgi:hypothetical protein
LASLETIDKGTGQLNDSIHYYFVKMKREFCNCTVTRFYHGNSKSKKFQGYVITEQIICNAIDHEMSLASNGKMDMNEKSKETDTTKSYEVQGHEH